MESAMMEQELILKNLLAAFAVGVLVGLERGWSDRKEKEALQIAGLRTFTLVGILGGLWAILSTEMGEWMLFAAFIVIAILVVVSHAIESTQSGSMGTTTAFSLLLTFSLAAWAALGYYIPALVTTVVVIALLGMKSVLHRALKKVNTEEAYAGLKLLVISVIFLPLLPNEGFGPYEALNPYWIWWMVVLICGISFIGYFAIKHIGHQWGTLVTSITGGLASSTAVTLSLSQFAKDQKKKTLFMGGVMIASSIMFIRMMIEVAVVNYTLIVSLWIPVLAMFIGVLAGGYWLWRRGEKDGKGKKIKIDNPFELGTALKFGAILGIILLLAEGMKEWFGDQGIYLLSFISGLVDVDAIALSLSKMALQDLSAEVAAVGIVIAAATNTIIKGFIFAFFAGFRESLTLIIVLFVAVLPGVAAALFLLLF